MESAHELFRVRRSRESLSQSQGEDNLAFERIEIVNGPGAIRLVWGLDPGLDGSNAFLAKLLQLRPGPSEVVPRQGHLLYFRSRPCYAG